MVEPDHEDLSISTQLGLLSISRSSFYYVPVGESEENLEIMRLLDEQYMSTPFYGVLRLAALLKLSGYPVNVKRVRRLMKLVNWRTIFREPKTTISQKTHYKYPYLLRNLEIVRCNQVWSMDITYIPMKKGFMYLTAIIDLHSRFVIHWSLSNTMTAEWCTYVLKEAIEKQGKPEIFNTDQGSQFTSDVFINELTREAILPGFYEYWNDNNTGHFLADLNLGFRLSDRYTLSMVIKNLTNTEYMGRPGDIQPHRSFSLRFSGKV